MYEGRGYEVREGKIFFCPRYTSEAMCKSVVDLKADEPNDWSTERLTRCWGTNPMDQQPGSNSSIGELQLLIF